MSKKEHLLKEIENFLAALQNSDGKPLYEMTPDEAREFLLSVQRQSPVNFEADVTDKTILTESAGEVNIRIVKPLNYDKKLPAIIYTHGGGWVMGCKTVYDSLIKRLSIHSGAAVIFVDYTRAPEAKYPTALNQICGVLEYVCNYPDEFDIDRDNIVIAGDSAGANMTAACALKSKVENLPPVKAQILLYPVTDASMDTKSYDDFKDGPWLTKKAMEYFWHAYLPDKKTGEEIFISPLKAGIEDLKNLPPALIITVENDVLRDEGEEYARKLDEAGVKVSNVRINGTIHDFMMLNALCENIQTKCTFSLVCSYLNKIFNK